MSVEEQLRRTFHAHAQRVQPSADALATIRARIARRAHLSRRITVGLASLSSAVVVTATAVIVGAVSCAPPSTPEPVPPADPSPTVTTTQPTPGPQGEPDRVPIYYLGQVGNRVVLYREFRTVTPADNTLPARIAAAVREMLRDDPLDPDYFGVWPDGAAVTEVRIEGDVAVVVLTGVANNNVGAELAQMTVEQLVWTVTAVAADAGSPVNGVRLSVDETSSSGLWGHVDITGVLRRGDSTQVQAPVWLISPQHGDTVGRTFTIHVDGTVFEATVNLRVRDASGTTVQETFVTLDEGAPARGEATTTLTLAPGRYTLEAFVYSMADGSVQAMDDHDITVT